MGDLINALLNASRLDVGVVAIEPVENVDVRDVLKGVITDLEAKINAKKITLQQEFAETVQPMTRRFSPASIIEAETYCVPPTMSP